MCILYLKRNGSLSHVLSVLFVIGGLSVLLFNSCFNVYYYNHCYHFAHVWLGIPNIYSIHVLLDIIVIIIWSTDNFMYYYLSSLLMTIPTHQALLLFFWGQHKATGRLATTSIHRKHHQPHKQGIVGYVIKNEILSLIIINRSISELMIRSMPLCRLNS